MLPVRTRIFRSIGRHHSEATVATVTTMLTIATSYILPCAWNLSAETRGNRGNGTWGVRPNDFAIFAANDGAAVHHCHHTGLHWKEVGVGKHRTLRSQSKQCGSVHTSVHSPGIATHVSSSMRHMIRFSRIPLYLVIPGKSKKVP